LTIVVQEGQSLRDIAQEYFNDPNLWREILRVNDLSSAEGVRAGMKLEIPRNAITLANSALVASLDAIQKATATGARVFSPDLLEQAVENRRLALAKRQASAWVECRDFALKAKKQADQALTLALAQRNAAAEAILKGTTGTVQRRSTSELVWNRVGNGTTLSEKERVRTMSNSSAEILFADESRIRLVANSQAVIQKMRIDNLNHQQEVSVSLEEGDVFALLSSAGKGRGVDVKVAGVTTDTLSTDFWVSRKGTQSKFANYDGADMKITSGGQTVTLGKNQGTIVEAGETPSVVRDLLPAVELVMPKDDFVQMGEAAPTLGWHLVEGAVHYKLEAASDPTFSDIVYMRSKVGDTEHQPKKLDDGVYYWRVTAVDELGFPGSKSLVRRFQVMQNVAAPFLAVRYPEEGTIAREPMITVTGEAARRGDLTVNGSPVEVAAEGSFSVDQALVEGENTIVLELRSESGKTTKLERRVIYMPDRPAVIDFDSKLVRVGPDSFATRGSSFFLAGRTIGQARVEVLGTTSGTYSDTEGRFELHLQVSEEHQEFVLRVTAPSGYFTEKTITVQRDNQPPELRFQTAPPLVTSEEAVRLHGSVVSASELHLNGNPVRLTGDVFDTHYQLEPGPNEIELVAKDRVGNELRWSRRILRDSDPPQLRSQTTSSKVVKGGEVVVLEVAASDATEMKRFASVLVQVGEWKETATLALEPDNTTYRGSIRIPLTVEGNLQLKHVILEDYLGNRKAYSLR